MLAQPKLVLCFLPQPLRCWDRCRQHAKQHAIFKVNISFPTLFWAFFRMWGVGVGVGEKHLDFRNTVFVTNSWLYCKVSLIFETGQIAYPWCLIFEIMVALLSLNIQRLFLDHSSPTGSESFFQLNPIFSPVGSQWG